MVGKSDPSLTISPLAEVTKDHVIVTAESPAGSVYTGNAKLDDPEVTVYGKQVPAGGSKSCSWGAFGGRGHPPLMPVPQQTGLRT